MGRVGTTCEWWRQRDGRREEGRGVERNGGGRRSREEVCERGRGVRKVVEAKRWGSSEREQWGGGRGGGGRIVVSHSPAS